MGFRASQILLVFMLAFEYLRRVYRRAAQNRLGLRPLRLIWISFSWARALLCIIILTFPPLKSFAIFFCAVLTLLVRLRF